MCKKKKQIVQQKSCVAVKDECKGYELWTSHVNNISSCFILRCWCFSCEGTKSNRHNKNQTNIQCSNNVLSEHRLQQLLCPNSLPHTNYIQYILCTNLYSILCLPLKENKWNKNRFFTIFLIKSLSCQRRQSNCDCKTLLQIIFKNVRKVFFPKRL